MRKEIPSMSTHYDYKYRYKSGIHAGEIFSVTVVIDCFEEDGEIQYYHQVYQWGTNELVLDPWTGDSPDPNSVIGGKLQEKLELCK